MELKLTAVVAVKDLTSGCWKVCEVKRSSCTGCVQRGGGKEVNGS